MYGKEERNHRLVKEGIAERIIAFGFEKDLPRAPLPAWRRGEQKEGQERVLSPSQKAEADGKAVAAGRKRWLERNREKREVERSAPEKQAGENGQTEKETIEKEGADSEQLELSFV